METEDSPLYREKHDNYYEGANPYLLKHIKAEWKEVLDIGCSRGRLGAAIKDKGIRVSGIEAFEEAAQITKTKLDHVIKGNIETMDLPYEKEQFDCIIFGDVLEHLFDGFHFYDVSQSFEFRKASYLVGVFNQMHPWCLHYNGDDFDALAYGKYFCVII
ncbi:glycosyltransferase [Bacillus sp. BP-3]|nr:glycosyltransferase [Bacillus sp. BP-3]MDC2863928.1 glycosyltransferase [Bacillus sp. BP-3]